MGAIPCKFFRSTEGDYFGRNSRTQIINRLEAADGMAIFHHVEFERFEVWRDGQFFGSAPSLPEAENYAAEVAGTDWVNWKRVP